jgi:hypothetical protein
VLSSSLVDAASHELHQLEDPEKLNANGGREHCQERSRLPLFLCQQFGTHAANFILQNRYTVGASTSHPLPYNPHTATKPSTEWLVPVSLVPTWPSPPNTISSISTSSREAYTPLHDESWSSFDNSFNATQWNTLASSAVNTFGDATVRFPPSAVLPTWDNGCVPDADPQNRPYPSVQLSTIQDELAIDEEQDVNETLLQPLQP